MKRVHLIISGDVQGIGYRAWALRFAQDKLVTGWVKNRGDGAVEIVAEGPRQNLEELIAACRRGPELAWVEDVAVDWQEAPREFISFDIVY